MQEARHDIFEKGKTVVMKIRSVFSKARDKGRRLSTKEQKGTPVVMEMECSIS